MKNEVNCFEIKGLIINEVDYSEQDKIIDVITDGRGRLSVYCRGAKNIKNINFSSTHLFSYSQLSISVKYGKYYLKDSELIEGFYNLRLDILKLSLATYFCDILNNVVYDESGDVDLLRLTLNSLYSLCYCSYSNKVIKISFEIKCACMLGFMPSIGECSNCGQKTGIAKCYYFDLDDGIIICKKCNDLKIKNIDAGQLSEENYKHLFVRIDNYILSAMNYIINSDVKKMFSYKLESNEEKVLSYLSEKFLSLHCEKEFDSLKFYKSISK